MVWKLTLTINVCRYAVINVILLNLLQFDDSQKGTDDVPHSDLPAGTAPTSDATNKDTHDPTVCC